MFNYYQMIQTLLDMIYLATAIGLTHGGSSRIHIYTKLYMEQHKYKKYIEQHKLQLICKSSGRAPSW